MPRGHPGYPLRLAVVRTAVPGLDPADGTAGPVTPYVVRTRLVEPSRLAGRMSGEVDHSAGDVESVVGQTLVKARHQRQLHRHRKCHLS